jgi:VWFA-related protein
MTARLLVAVAVASATLLAAEPPSSSDAAAPALIRMNAVVADARGRLVSGLNASDFQLAIDGVSQPIESVRFVAADAGTSSGETPQPIFSRAEEEAAASEDGARLFAIFLDEYHVSEGPAVARVRDVMTRFVQQTLKPRDLLLVVKPLDSLLTLQMTRDRSAALKVIAGFEGRRGEYDARNEFESNLIAGTPERIEAVRSQIATSALNALATHLAMLGGARKAILFVSEGYAFTPRMRGNEALPSIETAIRMANRGSVAIYPFDPRGPEGDAASKDREMLLALATQTEGDTIVDANPDAGLARAAAASGGYYVISFRAVTAAADGRFHPVAFHVNQPGAEVKARKGYWAPSPDDALRARLLARAKEPKPAPEPPRRISPLIRPWFGIARGAPGKTEVDFVWEPASRVPGDRARLSQPARLTLQAFAADGSQVFEGVVKASGSAGPDVSGDSMRATFQAAPGRLRLRMAIEDAAARPLDTDVRDLVVDPMTASVALGTPEVFRARNARDLRTLMADPEAVPVAAREFSRIERLLIRVPAYSPDGQPSVTARLASRAGSMRDLDVTPGPAPDRFQIDLPLAGLASGEYVIQLRVATSDSGESRADVSFKVIP